MSCAREKRCSRSGAAASTLRCAGLAGSLQLGPRSNGPFLRIPPVSGPGLFSARDPTRSDAIDALREIEFDRATGKLSDSDYDSLKATYTQRAVGAMRAEGSSFCPRCGPRPEKDARFCSNCGGVLG